MTKRHENLTATLVGVIVLAALSGCAARPMRVSSAVAGPTTKKAASPGADLPAGEGSAAFLDRVGDEKAVSENDAMRGLLMLLDGRDRAKGFSQRVKSLVERNVACSRWSFDADRPITKGKLAYMIYKACHVTGGVTLTVFGPSQWYCLKELQYQGFMQSGAVYAPVTGMQYIAALSRADHYIQTGKIPEVLRAGQ